MKRCWLVSVWQDPRQHDPTRDGDFLRWANGWAMDTTVTAHDPGSAIAAGVSKARGQGLVGGFHATAMRVRAGSEQRSMRTIMPAVGSVRWRRARRHVEPFIRRLRERLTARKVVAG